MVWVRVTRSFGGAEEILEGADVELKILMGFLQNAGRDLWMLKHN